MLTREGPVMTTSQRQALIRRVIDEAVGLGVLEPLLADETVTEIMVNGPGEVWVERDGRIERAPTSASPARRSSIRRSTGSSPRSTAAWTSRARWSTRACPAASAST